MPSKQHTLGPVPEQCGRIRRKTVNRVVSQSVPHLYCVGTRNRRYSHRRLPPSGIYIPLHFVSAPYSTGCIHQGVVVVYPTCLVGRKKPFGDFLRRAAT